MRKFSDIIPQASLAFPSNLPFHLISALTSPSLPRSKTLPFLPPLLSLHQQHTSMGKITDFATTDRIQSSAKLQTLQKDSSRGVLAATSPTLRAPTPNAPTPPLGPTNTQTSHDELPLHHSSTSTTSGGASNIKAASATNNVNTKAENEKAVVVEPDPKPPWSTRMKNGSIRFCSHTKEALFHSWINVLLVFVPIGIAMNWVPMSGTAKPTVVFAMNSVAIIPLAGLLSHATESVASRMGDTWASLLNVTFGNAVELIIL